MPDITHSLLLKDGRTLCYNVYGDQYGKPLLFFHGWPSSRLSGAEMDSAAKKLHVRVIAPDRPGFGHSTYQSGRTLLDWPHDVLVLLDQLKIKKCSIVGVSGGGPYAAVCAYAIPKKLHRVGIVVGLSPIISWNIMDGMMLSSKLGWYTYHSIPGSRCVSTLISEIIFKYLPGLGRAVGFQSKSDKEILRTILKDREFESSKEAYRQGIRGPMHDLKIYTDDWGFDLANIRAKVSLWYGAKDQNVSLGMGRYYHAQIPKSELFIDPHGGHLSRNRYEDIIIKKLMS